MRLACAATIVSCLVCACSGDDDDDGAEASGESAGSTTTSTSTSTETGTASTVGGSTESSDGADSSSTGIVYECYDYLERQCVGECSPLHGQPFTPEGDGAYCLGESLYLGCQDASINCAAVETVACDPDGTPFLFPSDCFPDFFTECDPPMDGVAPCG